MDTLMVAVYGLLCIMMNIVVGTLLWKLVDNKNYSKHGGRKNEKGKV